MKKLLQPLASTAVLVLAACGGAPAKSAAPKSVAARTTAAAPVKPAHSALSRAEFNRLAVRLNLPLYWGLDKNANGAADADEVKALAFYPTDGVWVEKGAFTPAFEAAYAKLVAASKEAPKPGADAARRALVAEDLDQGKATLVYSDLSALSSEEKSFVRHVLAATKLIDGLYATQKGIAPLSAQVPADDASSQSLFRRNWGPKCVSPRTEKDPLCSAIPGAPKPLVDVYPASLQKDPKFCEALEKNPNAKKLLDPFVVVREEKGALRAVPYTEAYKEPMSAIATELRAAAAGISNPKEAALKTYLNAAAQSFTDNNWTPADEAWAKMNALNSKFYLRIAADETYWEPCAQKAGFHVTFARINAESLTWQEKLAPVESEMETSLAALIGEPYKARKVSFHLPDFIDIIENAGDDRSAVGATIGQSLPNWGPVANEGRGRTVAMSNLYTDPDSLKVRRQQAESLFTKETLGSYADATTPGLLSTILHEATHNLGPAHEYSFNGKKDTIAFGGGLASMLEELKAQSGALYFVEFARKRNLITAELAKQTYVDSIAWGFGHISRGMYTESGERKAYSQLAAIQLGFLMDEGALTFDPNAMAANGTDKGAISLNFEKLVPAIDKLMKRVGTIKATTDKAGAEALAKKYVDGDVVPQKVITERVLRFPKPSFVYAIDL